MLSLTKEIDYALLALNYLALQISSKAISAKEIANKINIPSEHLAKILQNLSKFGLVLSKQGPNGGYFLGKDPSCITVSDVVKAVDKVTGIVTCLSDKNCAQELSCSIRTPMKIVNNKVFELLNNITLAELIKLNK